MKDLSKALFNTLKHEYELFNNSVDIEFDDITMKTKLVVRPNIVDIRFDENSFFGTILGFNPYWDFKHYNEYISQKIVNLNATNKIHLKCDFIDSSIQIDLRQPTFYTIVLDKPSDYKVFSERKTTHYDKINKSVLNTITF